MSSFHTARLFLLFFVFLLPVGFFGFFGPLSTEAFCCCFFGF